MVESISKEQLIFSDKQQIVLDLLEHSDNSDITEIFYGGAAGGGKSFLICHWQIARRLQYPGTRGLIGRESLVNLKKTTLKTFSDVWNDYYRYSGVTWRINWQDNIMYFSNGSEIVLMDLGYYPSDMEYHRLGSLEITDAVVDELPEIQQKAFEILQSRIRYKLNEVGGVPKCLATGNPSMNWVKNRYIVDKDNQKVKLKPHQAYVRATVHDNPDEDFKKVYISSLEKLSPVDKLRLLDGRWDVQLNENPFFYAYNHRKHYKDRPYQIDNRFELVFSFDFNADPCTCVVGQWNRSDKTFNVIGSHYASPSHRSALENLCDDLKRIYFPKISRHLITVTGDAAGKHSDADRPLKANRYTQIMNYLGIGNQQVKVESANIKHSLSRDLCNDVLNEIPEGYFIFWNGTEKLIENIQASYPDSNESLDKAKKELGLHDVDGWRYLMKYWFAFGKSGQKFREYQNFLTSYVRGIV